MSVHEEAYAELSTEIDDEAMRSYYVLQGRYGQGWEDITADETMADAKQSRRDYEENEGGVYRIVRRTEKTS